MRNYEITVVVTKKLTLNNKQFCAVIKERIKELISNWKYDLGWNSYYFSDTEHYSSYKDFYEVVGNDVTVNDDVLYKFFIGENYKKIMKSKNVKTLLSFLKKVAKKCNDETFNESDFNDFDFESFTNVVKD